MSALPIPTTICAHEKSVEPFGHEALAPLPGINGPRNRSFRTKYMWHRIISLVSAIMLNSIYSGCRLSTPAESSATKDGRETVATFLARHHLSLEEAIYVDEPPRVLSRLIFEINPKLGGRTIYLNLADGPGLFSFVK